MSSRVDSSLGPLGERVAHTRTQPAPGAAASQRSEGRERTPWCLVDGLLPGVIAQWTHVGGQWEALVAYVKDGELRTATVPAHRLSPR